MFSENFMMHEAASCARVALFDTVASVYTLGNQLLSFGMVGLWRKRLVKRVRAETTLAGAEICDVCCGTGEVIQALSKKGQSWTRMVGVDASQQMLERARSRLSIPCELVMADATILPFASSSFDIVTCAFGVRNLSNRAAALEEMRRVLRHEGRLYLLEVVSPSFFLWRRLFLFIFFLQCFFVGMVLRRKGAYAHFFCSVQKMGDSSELEKGLLQAGFSEVQVHLYFGGVVCLLVALERREGDSH